MDETPNTTTPRVEPAPGTTPTATGSKGLVDRAKDILLKPKEEWAIIDGEPATIAGLYTGYIMILAAIGPVAGLIGSQLFGYSALGFTYKPPLGTSIGLAVLTYVMSLITVYILALIIDALAPNFNGTKNQIQAFKVAAYSMTAGWLGGIFGIIPSLAMLGLLAGLYGLYLLYLGLPRLMRVSDDKAVGYTVVVIVAYIVVFIVIAAVVSALTTSLFGGLGTISGPGIR